MELGEMKLCRVCAEDCTELQFASIFEMHGEKSYAEMVAFCGQVSISNEDDLPKIICTGCCLQLAEAYRFCIKCQSAADTIRKLLDTVLTDVLQPLDEEQQLQDKIVDELIELPTVKPKDRNEILVDLMMRREEELFDEIIEESRFSDEESLGEGVDLEVEKMPTEVANLDGDELFAEEIQEKSIPLINENDENSHLNDKSDTTSHLFCQVQNVEEITSVIAQNHVVENNDELVIEDIIIVEENNIEDMLDETYDTSQSEDVTNEVEQFNFREISDDNDAIEKDEVRNSKRKVSQYKRKNLGLPPKEMIVEQEDHENYQIIYYSGVACCGCDKFFSSLEALESHCSETHQLSPPEGEFYCPLCFKIFRGPALQKRHSSQCEIPKLYHCKLCKYTCREKSVMERHMESSAVHDKPLIDFDSVQKAFDMVAVHGHLCCECYQTFVERDSLERHLSETHHKGRPKSEDEADLKSGHFWCSSCHQIFRNKHKYELHVNSAKMDQIYCCKQEFCTYRTTNVNFARFHLRSKDHQSFASFIFNKKKPTSDFSQRRCCFRKCLEVFKTKAELIEHVNKIHHVKQLENEMRRKKSNNVCSVCNCNFGSRRALKQHLKPKVHGFVCEICGAEHVSSFHLKTHVRKVHNNIKKQRDFKCDECSCSFVSEDHLRRHKEKGHEKENICSICGKEFKNKEGLWTHWRIHNKDQKYECEVCKMAGKRYSFRDLKTLNRHFKISEIHIGTRKFECPHEGCTSVYAHKPDLKRHEMTVHKGIRPFVCKVCDKGFVRNRDLRLHERTHTGGKLYNCKECNAGFNIYQQYKTHCKEVHGVSIMLDCAAKVVIEDCSAI